MGTVASGIAIKNTGRNMEETCHFLFGEDFNSIGYCDTRNSNCAYLGTKNELVVIINSDLANTYFKTEKIDNNFMDFFGHPSLVMAFKEYDSGVSYGYAIFQDGTLKRRLMTTNYDRIKDEFGLPLNIEKDWLEGEFIDVADGEKYLVNKTNKHEVPADFKYKAILQLIMESFLGLTCETMDDLLISSGYFSREEKNKSTIPLQHTSKKKWWEFRTQ